MEIFILRESRAPVLRVNRVNRVVLLRLREQLAKTEQIGLDGQHEMCAAFEKLHRALLREMLAVLSVYLQDLKSCFCQWYSSISFHLHLIASFQSDSLGLRIRFDA